MLDDLKMNADRFTGFADIYDRARPECPRKVTNEICPNVIIDAIENLEEIWSK